MREYLEKQQQVAFRSIVNTKKTGSFPQAILLNGIDDLPLLEIAKYVAASIVCQDESACGNCLDCLRIENGSYSDLIIIDGKKETIKKNEVQMIQDQFNKSALELAGKKIYIINYVENSTKQAINGLLKFLEEPDESLYAILTTANISNVLPTIVSRCLNVRLKNIPKSELIKQVSENDIPYEDCLILASFIGNKEEMLEEYQGGTYSKIKDCLIEFLKQIYQQENLLFFIGTQMNDIINNKVDLGLLLNLLEVVYNDFINIKNNREISFVNHEELISQVSKLVINPERSLEKILLVRGKLSANVNIKLMLDSLFISLKGDLYGQK